MRFRIDLKIFLILILFYFTKQIETYVAIMVFAFLHEMGHLLAGILLGMKPEKLEIMPYGVRISFKLFPKDYNKKIKKGNVLEVKKIIVALAGPTINLIILIFACCSDFNIISNLIIIYANILLIIFNLLPIYPLDGGRILKSILHIMNGKRKSEKLINQISFITLVAITLLASIIIYASQNIAIFLIVIILWIMYIKEDIKYQRKNKIYKLIEKTVEI